MILMKPLPSFVFLFFFLDHRPVPSFYLVFFFILTSFDWGLFLLKVDSSWVLPSFWLETAMAKASHDP